MGMRIMDGFEEAVINPYRWPTRGGSNTVSATYGRLGGKGLRLGDNTASSISRPFTLTDDTLIYAFAYQLRDAGGTNIMVTPYGPGSTIVKSASGDAVGLANINGISSADFFTPPGSIQFQTWHWLVFKVRFGDAPLGVAEIWVDGVRLVNETGLDLNPRPASINPRFGGSASSDVDEWWLDDLMILDGAGSENNNVPPEARVFTSLPDGNGATSGLTGSDGDQIDNYLNVDDDPVNLATWNASATDAALDTYAMQDTVLTGDVLAVQAEALIQKDDAGLKFGKVVVRSGTTDYPGPSNAALTAPSWSLPLDMYDLDPDTGLAWSIAGVDAAEIGMQVSDT